MPRVNFETYSTYLYGNRFDTRSNSAQIVLSGGSGGSARLYFSHNTAAATRAPSMQGPSVIAHYHMSELPQIIDLLRNEDSCYLWHNVSSGLVYIGTGPEEMGEEES